VRKAPQAGSGGGSGEARRVGSVLLPSELIDTSPEERIQHGKPWNSYHSSSRNPNVVITPLPTEHVSDVVRLCGKHGIPIIPYGGATSLEGQLLASQGGVSLDFCKMKAVVQLREGDLDVTVQAGLGYIGKCEVCLSACLPVYLSTCMPVCLYACTPVIFTVSVLLFGPRSIFIAVCRICDKTGM
jgi:hypothetical protein